MKAGPVYFALVGSQGPHGPAPVVSEYSKGAPTPATCPPSPAPRLLLAKVLCAGDWWPWKPQSIPGLGSQQLWAQVGCVYPEKTGTALIPTILAKGILKGP